MERSRFDIILTEGNLHDPEDGLMGFPKILGGMNLPIIGKYTYSLFPSICHTSLAYAITI